jgi:regulatory protein
MSPLGSARRRVAGVERAADPEVAREAALRLLERSRRTRSDLARRLRERGFSAPVIQDVIDRLAQVGLVDDVEYARAYLAGRWGRRSAGWRKLEQDLFRRGISAEDAAAGRALIEQQIGPADEVAVARRTLEQVERRYAALEPRVRRQRLYALLLRRGFSRETIDEALREGNRS